MSKQPLHVVQSVTEPDPVSVLPLRLQLDDGDTPIDVLDALLITKFTTGEYPAARSARVQRLREEATLLPAAATVIRTATDDSRKSVLATGDGWMMVAMRWDDGAKVTVTAVTDELAERVLAEAVEGAEEPAKADAGVVTMGFWYFDKGMSRRRVRDIAAPTWPQIQRNYTAGVSGAFDKLMAARPDELAGRLLLLHGPPGTGKTTALRALAQAWREWCQVDCVLDPERLFDDPAYLLEVAIGDNDDEKPWRLLLLEDCDELIRGEAKASTGQALSRLLNLTDGLLGQGTQILIGITTNENLARLHPAVTRSGRCLAQIEVGALSRDEATSWLGANAPSATLAELYALREGDAPVVAKTAEDHTSLYL